MSSERIQELLQLMAEHGLSELELEEGEFKVRLAKPTAPVASVAAPAPMAAAPAPAGAAAVDSDLVPIDSPIVGTFYRSPAPDADAFVKAGDSVDDEAVVCIVEAMKVMNEVKSGVRGTIAQILVENGEAVEYGQPLFLVKPA